MLHECIIYNTKRALYNIINIDSCMYYNINGHTTIFMFVVCAYSIHSLSTYIYYNTAYAKYTY